MKQLETILAELGITQHTAALSDWRDQLQTECATELQQVQQDAEIAVTTAAEAHQVALQAKEDVIATLTREKAALEALKTTMTQRVLDVIATGDPEAVLALGVEFITPEADRIRADKLAQLAQLKAELGVE